MKERPIAFSPEMVRAILDGRKTMTRRVVKPQSDGDGLSKLIDGPWIDTSERVFPCPHGVPGDKLWVRETCAFVECDSTPSGIPIDPFVVYFADGASLEALRHHGYFVERWTPSRFMPRRASRILLEIEDIRVERVQEISGQDVQDEGVADSLAFGKNNPVSRQNWERAQHRAFARLWNTIHKAKPEHQWDANPFVWVISFRRV